MSSSSNLSIARRCVGLIAPGLHDQAPQGAATPSPVRRKLLVALAAAPSTAFAVSDPLAGLQRWGQGEFRRFGFLIYDAALWAAEDPTQWPQALRLTYRRSIAGGVIAEASVREMRALGAPEADLQRWGNWMQLIFPAVRPGDQILGVFRKEGVRFLFNGREIGVLDDADFARYFAGIWLDPRTSAPDLRAALLRRKEIGA
jgi:hypothetical protein